MSPVARKQTVEDEDDVLDPDSPVDSDEQFYKPHGRYSFALKQ